MLPFLKKKNEGGVAGIIVKTRPPDEKSEQDQDDSKVDSIEYCAQDLLKAIESKDIKAIAEALRDVFDILDSQPHEEGEHIEKHSYDEQNQKAAEEQD